MCYNIFLQLVLGFLDLTSKGLFNLTILKIYNKFQSLSELFCGYFHILKGRVCACEFFLLNLTQTRVNWKEKKRKLYSYCFSFCFCFPQCWTQCDKDTYTKLSLPNCVWSSLYHSNRKPSRRETGTNKQAIIVTDLPMVFGGGL